MSSSACDASSTMAGTKRTSSTMNHNAGVRPKNPVTKYFETYERINPNATKMKDNLALCKACLRARDPSLASIPPLQDPSLEKIVSKKKNLIKHLQVRF